MRELGCHAWDCQRNSDAAMWHYFSFYSTPRKVVDGVCSARIVKQMQVSFGDRLQFDAVVETLSTRALVRPTNAQTKPRTRSATNDFITTFHVPRNDDLVMEAARTSHLLTTEYQGNPLEVSTRDTSQDKSPNMRIQWRSPDADDMKRATAADQADMHAQREPPPVPQPRYGPFVTSFRVPRNDDLKAENARTSINAPAPYKGDLRDLPTREYVSESELRRQGKPPFRSVVGRCSDTEDLGRQPFAHQLLIHSEQEAKLLAETRIAPSIQRSLGSDWNATEQDSDFKHKQRQAVYSAGASRPKTAPVTSNRLHEGTDLSHTITSSTAALRAQTAAVRVEQDGIYSEPSPVLARGSAPPKRSRGFSAITHRADRRSAMGSGRPMTADLLNDAGPASLSMKHHSAGSMRSSEPKRIGSGSRSQPAARSSRPSSRQRQSDVDPLVESVSELRSRGLFGGTPGTYHRSLRVGVPTGNGRPRTAPMYSSHQSQQQFQRQASMHGTETGMSPSRRMSARVGVDQVRRYSSTSAAPRRKTSGRDRPSTGSALSDTRTQQMLRAMQESASNSKARQPAPVNHAMRLSLHYVED